MVRLLRLFLVLVFVLFFMILGIEPREGLMHVRRELFH